MNPLRPFCRQPVSSRCTTGLARIACSIPWTTGSARVATRWLAATMAPTLRANPVRVCSRRWMVRTGKRASCCNSTSKLVNRWPNAPAH